MRSSLNDESRKELIRQARRMTPVQRLQAFVDHCRLVSAFQEAGKSHRARREEKKTSS